jgi:hypothetical protein
MGTKHRHYDVIVAWAAGEEVEYWSDSSEKWYPCVGDVIFRDHFQYRIKPKLVKKEGWMNVYDTDSSNVVAWVSHVYPTERDAMHCAYPGRKACIRITWEEEE